MVLLVFVILTDEEFLDLKNGREAICIKVYNHYKKPVFNLLLAKTCGNREVALDIMQETFLSAITSFHTVKNPGHLEAWLITIAKNKLIDHYRKTGREKKYMEKIAGENNSTADAADELNEKEQAALLCMGMEKIKPCYREVLTMLCWEKMKVKEIAEKIGRSPKAVENMLFKAKKSLKKQITLLYKDLERT